MMSAQILAAHIVLSPDPEPWPLTLSFRNLPPSLFLYYLIGMMIRKWTVPSRFPSFTFPVSDSDYVGFLFVRSIQQAVFRSFKRSDAVIHHFSLCTQLRIIFNCNCYEVWFNCFRWRVPSFPLQKTAAGISVRTAG